MTTVVLLAVVAFALWRMRVHTARMRRSSARLEAMTERAAADRLRTARGSVEASPIEAPASVSMNGREG